MWSAISGTRELIELNQERSRAGESTCLIITDLSLSRAIAIALFVKIN
ncbi:hypothetical protein QUB68_23125 [Microcoleus sp. A006_D1]